MISGIGADARLLTPSVARPAGRRARAGALGRAERTSKRALDLVVAASLLVVLSPLILLAAVAVRLETPGPILFTQRRRGLDGRPFTILKLRSMRVLEDGGWIEQVRRGDPRVTRVGRWLRRLSVDELPQLINVLRGEMSMVGPRPHALAHDDHYDARLGAYARRRAVKPGLTGWAQVRGHRGATPSLDAMAARVRHDLWYVDNWSLALDLRVLLLTPFRLLSRAAY